jgi:AraC-like DNA-binding protein
MKIGDISAPLVLLLLRTAKRLGADTDLLLAQVGLTAAQLRDPDTRIGLTELMKLGAGAIRMTGEPALGLYMGQSTRLVDMGLPGLLAMTCPTLDKAIDSLFRFDALNTRCYRGVPLWEPAQQALMLYSIAPYNEYNRFVIDSALTGWQQMIQFLTGRDDLVREVHIEFDAPDYRAAYGAAFQAPVYFGRTQSALILKPDASQLPVLHHEPLLHQQLITLAQERTKKLEIAATFQGRVQAILGPRLHGHTPSLEETAHLLNMPDWTLRRKLREEGASFQSLLDNMRKDLALGYMRDTQISFGEIAYILGFSTPGAFQRAFKRWTKETPGDYRRRINQSVRPQ